MSQDPSGPQDKYEEQIKKNSNFELQDLRRSDFLNDDLESYLQLDGNIKDEMQDYKALANQKSYNNSLFQPLNDELNKSNYNLCFNRWIKIMQILFNQLIQFQMKINTQEAIQIKKINMNNLFTTVAIHLNDNQQENTKMIQLTTDESEILRKYLEEQKEYRMKMHQKEASLSQESYKIKRAYEIISEDLAVACQKAKNLEQQLIEIDQEFENKYDEQNQKYQNLNIFYQKKENELNFIKIQTKYQKEIIAQKPSQYEQIKQEDLLKLQNIQKDLLDSQYNLSEKKSKNNQLAQQQQQLQQTILEQKKKFNELQKKDIQNKLKIQDFDQESKFKKSQLEEIKENSVNTIKDIESLKNQQLYFKKQLDQGLQQKIEFDKEIKNIQTITDKEKNKNQEQQEYEHQINKDLQKQEQTQKKIVDQLTTEMIFKQQMMEEDIKPLIESFDQLIKSQEYKEEIKNEQIKKIKKLTHERIQLNDIGDDRFNEIENYTKELLQQKRKYEQSIQENREQIQDYQKRIKQIS